MKIIKWLFRWRKNKRAYGFTSKRYKPFPYPTLEQLTGAVSEDFRTNFAMIIPKEAHKPIEMVEDPRGAPVYAPCPAKGEPCACTGACRKILSYTKDPTALTSHRQNIATHNWIQKNGLKNLYKWETKKPDQHPQ